MKNHTFLQEDEMIHRAINALLGALGPIETVRFLTLPHRHRLDSVMRHQQWQNGLDKDCFFDQVFDVPETNGFNNE